MKIIGINDGNSSSAAILIDGKIVAAALEERFTRKKQDAGYPRNAVKFCLNFAKVDPQELDAVAIGGIDYDPTKILVKRVSRFTVSDYIKENHEYWKPLLIKGKEINYYFDFVKKHPELQCGDELPYDFSFLETTDPKDWLDLFRKERARAVAEDLGIPESRVYFIDHHQCHAAYAYYSSPHRDDMLVLTADGQGDGFNASINFGNKNNLIFGKKISSNNLGRLYSWSTLILGMKPYEHEYKVMGLAPYSKPYTSAKAFEIYSSTLVVDGDEFKWNIKPGDMYFWFKEKLEGCRFDGIAAGLQRFTEERIVEWVRNILEKNRLSKIVFSGGLSLNVKANKKIMEMPEIENIFVPGSGGDDSLSIGAAYHYFAAHCDADKIDKSLIRPLSNMYLGPEFSNQEIRLALEKMGTAGSYEIKEGVTDREIAEYLVNGKIIARCSGRMEFGARALGNRSILADPRNQETVRVINEMIKNRDFWMPFTPSILQERAADYIINPKGIESPYMTQSFDSTDLGRKELKAAIHPYDKTVRPQIVLREANPDYYNLIKEFEKLTGVGALLNTSLNLHGEPIVCSPQDALNLLEKSGIDIFLLNDILVIKN